MKYLGGISNGKDAVNKEYVDTGRIYFVKGTQTATTAAWTGNIDADALFDGMTIAYYLPRTSASSVTLNLTLSNGTTTGAKEVYVSSTTRMTTHYAAGSTIYLTYWSKGSISINGAATTTDRWTGSDYWTDNTYDRTYINNTYKAATALTAGFLVCGTDAGYKNVAKGTAFDIAYPLLYTGTAIAANATRTDGYIQIPVNCTTTNGGSSPAFTAYKMVYLKGKLSGNTFTIDSSTLFTQAVPTSADGYQYYSVGIAGSATNIFLTPHHDVYEYSGSSFHKTAVYALDAAKVNGHTVAKDVPSNAVFTDTTYSAATQSAQGLMSAADKKKLDGIATGAQVNSVTGVKGNSESTYRTGNVNLTAANIGAAAASHTHAAGDISSVYEANLIWGGKNFSGSYAPIDASMIPELGANRFAFLKPAGVTIEYSRDAGSTWTDYGATDEIKLKLFGPGGAGLVVGKNTDKATNEKDYQLRITIDTGAAGIYTSLNKFALYLSTNGSSGCTCTIQRALQSTPTTFVDVAANIPVSGWSGWNIINVTAFTTYGNTESSQNGRVRFIFKVTGGNTSYAGLTIARIMAFGGVGWIAPSTMASTGHLYKYDENQNATFPAQITATKFNGPATKISDSANGQDLTITYSKSGQSSTSWLASWNKTELGAIAPSKLDVGKVNGHTVGADVPSDAKFTDTNNAVTQTATTGNADYEILFSSTADNTTRTEGARKNSNLKFNPSTGNLQATQLNGVAIGTSPKFTDTTYAVTSKTAAGLAPQLPNETTTTKYLRQDGTWVVPPNTTTGTTYAAASVPNNTTFGTNGSIKAVYDAAMKLNQDIDGGTF